MQINRGFCVEGNIDILGRQWYEEVIAEKLPKSRKG
jgi:hypothetical protein